MGKKFRQNRSSTHRLWDKYIFAFYAEGQDGRQKWRENDFLQKLASRPCGSKISSKSLKLAPFQR